MGDEVEREDVTKDESIEDSLSHDLAAAWEKAEDVGSPEVEQNETDELDEQPEQNELDEPLKVEAEKPEEKTEEKPEEKSEEADKPPQSMNAAERERWKDAPSELKAYMSRREAEFNQGMQKNAEMAKRAEGMDRTLAPYQQFFAMNGGSPGETINGVLQAAATLQMGSSNQKAGMIANLIKQFDVPVDAVDQMLVGEQPQEQAKQPDIQALVRQEMAPILNQFQQQREGEVTSELEKFAQSHEFYSDVASTMADLLDLRANQGKPIGLDEAYELACQINPTVKQAIDMRKAAEAVEPRKAASVSLRGRQSGPIAQSSPADIRGTLESAWDEVARGT